MPITSQRTSPLEARLVALLRECGALPPAERPAGGLLATTSVEAHLAALFAEERSYSIDGFCEVEDISKSSYNQLQKLGLGPREMRIPGTRIIRITAEARREWKARMAELSETEQVQLEAERMREHARRAAAKSALSEKHVSKTGKRATRNKQQNLSTAKREA
jgi:hypothetical protein